MAQRQANEAILIVQRLDKSLGQAVLRDLQDEAAFADKKAWQIDFPDEIHGRNKVCQAKADEHEYGRNMAELILSFVQRVRQNRYRTIRYKWAAIERSGSLAGTLSDLCQGQELLYI